MIPDLPALDLPGLSEALLAVKEEIVVQGKGAKATYTIRGVTYTMAELRRMARSA